MSGHAKRQFENYIYKQKKMFYEYIKDDIIPILPSVYNFDDIYKIIETYYPFELEAFKFNLDVFRHKNKTLKKRRGITRYNALTPREYIYEKIIHSQFIKKKFIVSRVNKLNEEVRIEQYSEFVKKRENIISKRKSKVEKAQKYAQHMEPKFIDKMIGLYERKITSHKDKVYILHELSKYYCDRVRDFYSKELSKAQNKQLREKLLKSLQDYGYEPILGKLAKNSKTRKKKGKIYKEYINETYNIASNPEELLYLINNHKSQKFKSYDYFISHSYIDGKDIQKLIDYLNSNGKNVYCDWIADNDYLKRELLCRDTLEVIENRINISDAILFVKSENSIASKWVAYELQYAEKNNKPIYVVDLGQWDNIRINNEYWFRNLEQDKLKLYTHKT